MHDHHHHPAQPSKRLLWALSLTLAFAAIEAMAGLMSGSLALVSDAGHMLTDSVALGLAALAATLSLRPPSHRHSYGLARLEVLAALCNAGFMLALVLWIGWHAIDRLLAPQPVKGEVVTVVAAIGLALNLAVAALLMGGGRSLNTRAALLHVMGDALGSVAALASGIVIQVSGWTPADPLLSLAICALIAVSTLRLAREALHTLLEGVPADISLPQVGERMARIVGVRSVHDLHIWSISSTRAALSAHVVLAQMSDWDEVLARLRELLHAEFDIDHVTLQPEIAPPAVHRIAEPGGARKRVREGAGSG